MIFGGWQVQGIVSRQSGSPIGFGNAIFTGNLKDIPLGRGERDPARWFNVNAGFQRGSALQLADNIRTLPSYFSGIRNDGQHVWDLSALKYSLWRSMSGCSFGPKPTTRSTTRTSPA